MATTKNQRTPAREAQAVKQDLEQTRELTRDVVDYLTEYAAKTPEPPHWRVWEQDSCWDGN